jgi:hypothetical protein
MDADHDMPTTSLSREMSRLAFLKHNYLINNYQFNSPPFVYGQCIVVPIRSFLFAQETLHGARVQVRNVAAYAVPFVESVCLQVFVFS